MMISLHVSLLSSLVIVGLALRWLYSTFSSCLKRSAKSKDAAFIDPESHITADIEYWANQQQLYAHNIHQRSGYVVPSHSTVAYQQQQSSGDLRQRLHHHQNQQQLLPASEESPQLNYGFNLPRPSHIVVNTATASAPAISSRDRSARQLSREFDCKQQQQEEELSPSPSRPPPPPLPLEAEILDTVGASNNTTSLGLKGSSPLIRLDRIHILLQNNNNNDIDNTVTNNEIQQSNKLTRSATDPSNQSLENKIFTSTSSRNTAFSSTITVNSPALPLYLPEVAIKDLSLSRVIGGGAFGQVWEGLWMGTPVAVKILNNACQLGVPDCVMDAFEEEVNILARLRHPNICMFLGTSFDPPNRAIVTELVARGCLWNMLRTPNLFNEVDCRLFHWPLWVTRRVLDGTCRGLVYLHNHSIIHRDMKSANLLLDDGFNIKICDFGLARLKDYTTAMTANVGTIQWMAPEVLCGKAYSESSDIYSLGLITWEILTGKCPYEDLTQYQVAIGVVQENLRPPIPSSCTPVQAEFLQTCWAENPATRFTAHHALKELEAHFPVHA